MNLEKRMAAFVALGAELRTFLNNVKNNTIAEGSTDKALLRLVNTAFMYNGWFTKEGVLKSLSAWAELLTPEHIGQWLGKYNTTSLNSANNKRIGVIMAGNIPMVGFHDVLSVLMTGHQLVGKTASQDAHLLPYLLNRLVVIEPEFSTFIEFTDRIVDIDAVIATGSNNSARYFEYYFGKYPHVIRKNRNSVAVLNGNETPEQIQLLGLDIFDYYGLGCRNVSKLYVPKGYSFDTFYPPLELMADIYNHNKYANNYDYNRAIYLMNQEPFLDNGFLMVKESTALSSPVAVLYYEYYETEAALEALLTEQREQIQCILSGHWPDSVAFGEAQKPALWDYADNVDTLYFLLNL